MHKQTPTSLEQLLQCISNDVDAGMEQFVELESGEGQLLQFVSHVTQAAVHACTVSQVLNWYHQLLHAGLIVAGTDRIVAVQQHLCAQMHLELARRYA